MNQQLMMADGSMAWMLEGRFEVVEAAGFLSAQCGRISQSRGLAVSDMSQVQQTAWRSCLKHDGC